MLLLEGVATSRNNNEMFTRDPFRFLYDKLPGGGHKVTVCYLLNDPKYVGSYGSRTRKSFNPQTDAVIRRELPNIQSSELQQALQGMLDNPKYNAIIANNAVDGNKRQTMPLDLGLGRLCMIKKYQFNWITKPTFAKRFGETRDGSMKIDKIMDVRAKYGFGAPDVAYTEDDWQTKPTHQGTRLYPKESPDTRRFGFQHTDDHGGSALYTRPWENIQALRMGDLPYEINGDVVIDRDGTTLFGTTAEFSGAKASGDSKVLVDMNTYNQITELWSDADKRRFGTAENPDIMYTVPVTKDARYDTDGNFDNGVYIRQSFDRTNAGHKILVKKWFYIESSGNFVEISEDLVNAMAAKDSGKAKEVENISDEEKRFNEEIAQIEDGDYGQETFSIDRLLYMNCDKFQYLGDEAVADAIGVSVECVQDAIEKTDYTPNFDYEDDEAIDYRATYARSLGYDTDIEDEPISESVSYQPTNIDYKEFENLFKKFKEFIIKYMEQGEIYRVQLLKNGTNFESLSNQEIYDLNPKDFVEKHYGKSIICNVKGRLNFVLDNTTTVCQNAYGHRTLISNIDGNRQNNDTVAAIFFCGGNTSGEAYFRLHKLMERPEKIPMFESWIDLVDKEMIERMPANESADTRCAVRKYLDQFY